MPILDITLIATVAAASASGLALLGTALTLGIRHGFDWDHIAAIADVTSTSAAATAGEAAHREAHRRGGHRHAHEAEEESPPIARTATAEPATPGAVAADAAAEDPTPAGVVAAAGAGAIVREQRRAVLLGTLYALGHASVVAVLGLGALLFGALLPDWVDPIMGRIVGITLLVLGAWVFASLYQYLRYGAEFRLRSRWMLVFHGVRVVWRRFQARLHGHAHVEPVEMASYGRGTAFAVGMIHGVGAETGSQVLLIAAIGGAADLGMGVPMMAAFIVGLLIANTIIVVISATGFVASQLRTRIYLAVGLAAGIFSVAVGLLFLLGEEGRLPDPAELLGSIGA